MSVLRTKTVEQSVRDTDDPERGLRRSLGPIQLTAIGIGVIIGTGIFVLTGEAAGTLAGPAITLSFVAAGIACFLAALCYAEFAAVVPAAGSAYTFSYASLGELIAWIIGWDLILELALGAATVASGWSQYLQVVLTSAPWPVRMWARRAVLLGMVTAEMPSAGSPEKTRTATPERSIDFRPCGKSCIRSGNW